MLLAAIVALVGLWGASHVDEVGISAPPAATSMVAATPLDAVVGLPLIPLSEPTRLLITTYAVFFLKKKPTTSQP